MPKDDETGKCFQNCSSSDFWKLHVKNCFPILTWLPQYTFEDFKGDLISGLTVGLTVIPQALALAQLAGLPLQYGLYTAIMGSFMYAVFGTCKDLVIGPTSVMAIMTADYVLIGGPSYAVFLTFLSGIIQLLCGVLNLGFLVNFISASVLSGFTTAAAIIIATSQLKGFLGLKFQSRGFLENVYKVFLNIRSANLYDFAMGVLTTVFLNFLKQYKDSKCNKCLRLSTQCHHLVQIFWWSFATARNLIAVLMCSVIAATFASVGKHVFTLTQHVDAGLPQFSIPPFTVSLFDSDKNTTVHLNTWYIMKDLGSGAIVIPFVSLLEAIAIAKVFSRSKRLDATKEMVALGMGNIMGSLVSAYPATGSFSRTVINNSTGVRTPLGGIFSGMLVLLALGLIAPSFHYIPKACLSAIIFSAVIFMVHYQDIPAMWGTSKLDLIPFSVTFCLSITLGLEYGLLLGVVISLGMLLYRQNKPKINIKFNEVDRGKVHIHVTPDICIFFPSVECLKGKLSAAVRSIEGNQQCKIIIHGNRQTGIDYTTAMGIKSMAASLMKENITVEIDASEPSALKALSCLKDCVSICQSQEEMQDLITASATDENHQKDCQEDINESDSTIALLAATKLKVIEAHNVV